MILATSDDLLAHFADLVDELERYAVTLAPPADSDDVAIEEEDDGTLVVLAQGRLPMPRRSDDVHLVLHERWRPVGGDLFTCAEYQYELRHHGLDYRRALHRHDEEYFVRKYGVATHEHCEATLGIEACGHYFGEPVADASDAFRRLYNLWLTDEKPDCRSLRCLG